MVAIKTLIDLPNKEDLVKLSQSLAMLDAIMEINSEYRNHSFNSEWNSGEMLASKDNGAGDNYFIFFNKHGVIIKGFDHVSEMNLCDEPEEVWKGVLDEVPIEFQSFLKDEAFPPVYTTFCVWRLDSEGVWKTGKIQYPEDDETEDGSGWLLDLLDGKPETYCEWAKYYYCERAKYDDGKYIDFETVEKIYRHEPLTEEMVKKLNPKRSLADLKKDIKEIGYPFS